MEYRRLKVMWLTGCAVSFLLPATAWAQSGTEDETGGYVRGGVTVGFPDPDLDVDVDAGGGFSLAGGYRATSWLAGEADLTFVTGAEVEDTDIEVEFLSFTLSLKGYPLGALDGVQWFQPYLLLGIGAGYLDADELGDDTSFVARFGAGTEFLFHRHIGAYLDAGYHLTPSEEDLDGVGTATVGMLFRF